MTDLENPTPSPSDAPPFGEGAAFDDQAALSFEIAAMRMRASWDDLPPVTEPIAASMAVPADPFAPFAVSPAQAPEPALPPAAAHVAPAGIGALDASASFLQGTPAPSSTRSYAALTSAEAADLTLLKSKRAPGKQRALLFAAAGVLACAGLWAIFAGGDSEPADTAAAEVAAPPSTDSAPTVTSESAPGTAFVNSNPGALPHAMRPAPGAQAGSANAARPADARIKEARREVRPNAPRLKDVEAKRRRPEPVAKPAPARTASVEPARKRPVAEARPAPAAPATQRTEPAKVSEPPKRKGSTFVSTNPY